MKVNYNWLKEYLDGNLPEPKELGNLLDDHAYEVESIETLSDGNAVLDIDILPNRAADSLCHHGIAREISAVLDIPFKDREIPNLEAKLPSTILVEILDDKKCPRYIGKKINDIEIKESPEWLKEKLLSLGQKPINNVVDSLNFVMFDMGQPMHAFDAEKVIGKIVIRNANEGEKITTLDNKEIELRKEDLVIADEVKALAIAGVKGGKLAEVNANTKNIILEAANFNQAAVRYTSRRLNLITDASKRFENGVAPEFAGMAIMQAAALIKELGGNDKTEVEDSVDIYKEPAINPFMVGVSLSEINKLLGTNLKREDVESILKRFNFGFRVVRPLDEILENASKFVGATYIPVGRVRYDAPNKFSCSSFTNYLYILGGFGIPSVSVDQYKFARSIPRDEAQAGDLIFSNSGEGKIHYQTKEWMSGTEVPEGIDHCGLYLGDDKVVHATRHAGQVVIEEISESKSFTDIKGYGRIVENPDEERFVVTIPPERLDLRIKEDLIEEVGRLYGLNNIEPKLPGNMGVSPQINKTLYWKEKIKDVLVGAGFDEVYTYSFAEKGGVELLNPLSKELPYMRPDLAEGLKKSFLLNSKNISLLGIDNVRIFEIGKVFEKNREYLQLGVAVEKNDKSGLPLNLLEEGVNNAITAPFYYEDADVNILLVNLDELINALPVPESYDWQNVKITSFFEPISNYPFVLRDIAAWVPLEDGKEALFEVIKTKAGDLLKRADLFDSFEKEGRVSYAYHLVFQALDKTLTDAEVNTIMEEIYTEAKSRNFEIR